MPHESNDLDALALEIGAGGDVDVLTAIEARCTDAEFVEILRVAVRVLACATSQTADARTALLGMTAAPALYETAHPAATRPAGALRRPIRN